MSFLRSDEPRLFGNSTPRFVFIDPFGATGVPFSEVKDILSSPSSEVLINHDADGIGRILLAGKDANADDILDEVFGGRVWEDLRQHTGNIPTLCLKVFGLYKQLIHNLPRMKYVFPFEMRTTDNSLNYYLVFASQVSLGLVKMKESMRQIDQDGTYRFTDARVDQPPLLRFDDVDPYARSLIKGFRGRTVTYPECLDFSLLQTPFTNPKAMLKVLDREGHIEVISTDPKRRKGTFNEEKIQHIKFLTK